MLAWRREERGEDEVDLAPRVDPVAREAGGGEGIPDGNARLGRLFPKQPRRRGHVLIEEAKFDLVLNENS